MVDVHMVVGLLVLVSFLALTILNVLAVLGRPVAFARPLSFAAAGLLLFQYLLGFSLLGSDHKIRALHYIFALAAILTVGLEHGYARTRETPELRARVSAIATGLTTILVLTAYGIAESR